LPTNEILIIMNKKRSYC